MLQQHFEQIRKSLENPEILALFSKALPPDHSPVKRPVGRTVASSASVSSPPKTSSARSSKVNVVSSPSRSTTKRSAPEKMQSPSSRSQGSKKSSEQRTPSSARPSSRQSVPKGPSAVTRDDLQACKYCTRRFASDRLAIHEDICAKTARKKRKAYDATRHRVQGTELEPYTRKLNRSGASKPVYQSDAGNPIFKQPNIQKQSKAPSGKKTDWRRKHEEFIGAIRAAKMAQQHVAKGGKLSDLPPPPPSSNPDYVQCPHCGRRFNETAAQRHIPKCATFEFNKSKPQQRSVGGRNSTNKSR